jgi:hypothetical protein
VALLELNLAVWALLDFLHSEANAPLALDGLFGWACYLLLAFAGCALVARVESSAANTRALLVPALSVSPYVLVLFWLASDRALVQAHPVAALVVALIYMCALTVRVVGAAFGPVLSRTAATAVALVLVAPWVMGFLNLDTRLWVAEEEPDQTEETADEQTEAEALFYDQPAQIAAAVARVESAAKGTSGVYFVGFAGDGEQGVFRREALFASQVFAERFGTGSRTVLLVNNVEDRDTYPLASVSGLAQTLKALASRMRLDDDVLVLFLTSHGSEDGLEVENGSLPLSQLAPGDLRHALDDSGIKWRILVVSACYAGVFLEELKTDTTAVITASDASHNSFGCEEDRELTWFGEAFLKDSLPRSATLEEAFHRAAALVARREDASHEVHSNPQMYVGPLMRRKLGELHLSPPESEHGSVTVRR